MCTTSTRAVRATSGRSPRTDRAFDRWSLRPRILRGAGHPDPSASILGTPISFPVLVAPWAYQSMAHPDGERATARAAAAAGTIMVVSSTAIDVLEEVAAASDAPKWWQLYVFEDRDVTTGMLARVVEARYEAICLTVDLPMGPGADPRPPAAGEGGPDGRGRRAGGDGGCRRDRRVEPRGRQLDGVPAGITALPEVVGAVAGRVPVLMDGGVRRGTDILKALALGAAAVMVGRPLIWGLAVDGEAGVSHVLSLLRAEFENAMALTGCRTVAEITHALVTPAP